MRRVERGGSSADRKRRKRSRARIRCHDPASSSIPFSKLLIDSSLGICVEKSKTQAPFNRLSDVDVIRESLIKPPDFRARFRRWWESTSACSLVWYSRIQANERAHIHAGTEPHCLYPLAEARIHSRAVAITLSCGRIHLVERSQSTCRAVAITLSSGRIYNDC